MWKINNPEGNETGKVADRLAPFVAGRGLDLGCGPWKLKIPKTGTDFCLGVDGAYFGQAECVDVTCDVTRLELFSDESFDYVYCTPAGQRVLTPDGWRPIEQIRVGDIVVGRSGFVTVKNLFSFPYSSPLVSFETPQGSPIVTGNHPIATPLNWLNADKLRESTQVVCCPPEIKPSHFVNRDQINRFIGSLASLGPFESCAIPTGDSSLAKTYRNFSLSFFPHEIRKYALQKFAFLFERAMNSKASSFFRSWTNMFNFVLTTRNLIPSQYAFNIAENDGIRIGNLYAKCNYALPLYDKTYRSFTIDKSSQPSPICFSSVHNVRIHHSVDRVYNLETSDGTFFLEGVLTHNSSHTLEDMPYPAAVLKEWWRVIKPGGRLILYLPLAKNVAKAIGREDWENFYPNKGENGANPHHQHDYSPEEIRNFVAACGPVEIILDEVRGEKEEYSFLQVFRKLASKHAAESARSEVQVIPNKRALVVRYG